MNEIIENSESEFSINQEVQIIKGLYNGHYGHITTYDKKTMKYHVEVMIQNNKKTIACNQIDLIRIKTWLGIKVKQR